MPASKELFQKYPNPVWVETGSWHGDGIQQALDAGFKNIYSIELSHELYLRCCDRFKDVPGVTLIEGDSCTALAELLSTIKESITFWLDGHFSGGDTVLGKYKSPLMQELDAIARHPLKNHTIIIDDLRDWYVGNTGFNLDMIKKKIKSINPDYSFTFADNQTDVDTRFKDDILIATG
jgi:hypothetical protein